MTPRICVSILPKNTLEALKLIKKAEESEANLIEVRLDYFKTFGSLSELVESTKLPLIATNKLLGEGGFFAATETERQQILLKAAKNGFAYVDVNLTSSKRQETIQKLERFGTEPIISYHKFDGVLSVSEMEKVLEQEIASGASVCKIIGKADKIEDNIGVLNFVASHSSKTKLVCFCMGEAGKVSRLLSLMFGAFLTYASLGKGSETAAGQMTIDEMRVAYDILGA